MEDTREKRDLDNNSNTPDVPADAKPEASFSIDDPNAESSFSGLTLTLTKVSQEQRDKQYKGQSVSGVDVCVVCLRLQLRACSEVLVLGRRLA